MSSIIRGANRVIINGGSFQMINRTPSDFQALPSGVQQLIRSDRISRTSFYNSEIRMNEANEMAVMESVGAWRQFLEYRTTVRSSFDYSAIDDAINAIFSWVTDSSAESLIMWVHDDDKTKTSFIAQVVAYLLSERGQLSATYFFDGHTDRGSVVPTFVHEFTTRYRHVDVLLNAISSVIENNPRVFNITPRQQLCQLLVDPLKVASESYKPGSQPLPDNIILLHAFEDCSDEGNFQESFLSALSEALSSIKGNTVFPQRLLLIGKRTDQLTEFLMRSASHPPVVQQPVQSQHWLQRDQDIPQKTAESARQEDETWRLLLAAQENEEKIRQELLRHEQESERIKELYLRKEQEVAERETAIQEGERIKALYLKKEQEVAQREKAVQERESKVREGEASVNQQSKKIRQREMELQIRENEIKIREDELARASYSSIDELPRGSPTPVPINYVFQETGTQVDGRMIAPASQVTKSDKIIILMGPLVSQKHDFIDCLIRCTNPWRFHPSTKTSNQFFDSMENDLGKGRFWVKAVRTLRQSHSILFVDFPSLGDDDLAAPKILENIAAWLNEVRKNEVGKITGILYFHPLLESESRGPSHRNLRALGQICGDKAAKKVIFVFQELSPSTAQERASTFFQQHYGHLMNGLGAGFASFDNTAATGWGIVDSLLPPSEDVSLLLQDELFVSKRSLHDTYAARRLHGDLIVRYTARLRGLDMSASGSNQTDEGIRRKFKTELERLQLLQSHRLPMRRDSLLAKPVDFPNLADVPETD